MRSTVLPTVLTIAVVCAACGTNNDTVLISGDAGTDGEATDAMVDMGPSTQMRDLGTPDFGECSPELEDVPDPYFFDANCDGMDGDEAQSVFVADYGDDLNPGTRSLPKKSIEAALETAQSEQKSWVLVADGLHDGGFELVDGVGIAGGYGFGWQRESGFRTTIRGGNPVIQGVDIASPTLLIGFEVEPKAMPEPGETVISILLEYSPGVTLRDLTIEGGVGGDGEAGTTGLVGADGNTGAPGDDGREDSSGLCDSDGKPAVGRGATNSCSDANGGDGGEPGKENDAGQTGDPGAAGAGGGEAGPASQPGGPGEDGERGENGTPGVGGTAGGAFDRWEWEGEDGKPGVAGEPGQGGGGGGGGGGGSAGCDSWGGAGGGGGSGGCGGQGGTAGRHGGAGVALFLINSDIAIVECTIIGGTGGAGGRGGDGGPGGRPGPGGPGGSREDDSGKGGKGGSGGVGGYGGQGGGGAGGPGYAIYSTTPLSELPINTELTDGVGGPGGISSSAMGNGADGVGTGLGAP